MSSSQDTDSGFSNNPDLPDRAGGWEEAPSPNPVNLDEDPIASALYGELVRAKSARVETESEKIERNQRLLSELYDEAELFLAIQLRSSAIGAVDYDHQAIILDLTDDFSREVNASSEEPQENGLFDHKRNTFWVSKDAKTGDIIITKRTEVWVVPVGWSSDKDIDYVDEEEETALMQDDADYAYLEHEELLNTDIKRDERRKIFARRIARHQARLQKLKTNHEKQRFINLLEHGQRIFDPRDSDSVEIARIPRSVESLRNSQQLQDILEDARRPLMDVRGLLNTQLTWITNRPGRYPQIEQQYDRTVLDLYKTFFIKQFKRLHVEQPSMLQQKELSLQDVRDIRKYYLDMLEEMDKARRAKQRKTRD